MRHLVPLLLLTHAAFAQNAQEPTPTNPSNESGQTPSDAPPAKAPPPRPAYRPVARPRPSPRRYADDDSGLQLVLGLGGAFYQDTTTATAGSMSVEAAVEGTGSAGIIAVGWELTSGVVIGLGGGGGTIAKPKVTIGSTSVDATEDLFFTVGGGYLDIGLSSGTGLHLFGILGVATLDPGSGDTATGFGGTLGLEYRLMLTDDWGLGFIALVHSLMTTADDVEIESTIPAGLISIVWQ